MLMDAKESIYSPTQDGLIFPQEPVFSSSAEERRYRKEHLAAACRIFARHGFSFGFGGHLTVRDPEHPELFWTNPMCVPWSRTKTSQLVLVDHSGTVIEGKYAVNRAGYVLHSAIHAENPDIIGSCHAHTVNGDAWAAMGKPLDYVTQDACMFYGSHTVVRDGAGKVPVANESGNPIARAFADNKAIIHQNHGLLTASRHSIDDAVWTFIALDHCCKMQLLMDATESRPIPIDPKFAEYSHEHLGNSFISWLHFQTMLYEIAEEEPDYLD
ncbi:class II aldolase/adducin family protein [Caballeronia sp. LZ062]|uniref:class II aldolase/adducin family protein n=1 Tax=unclassified Caballeronia TaxID=2646786 RepID=UPI00285D716D|nr:MULTISPECIES: class II aldolase/adducin family protein [unclassified Caballeronia]MDR5857699.1 class II aldolase/adducin family protein [Caballeronia sp. LZ050]MDR5869249.1 class II aldolase/adducin family protein [Caballeronia sp. LZ062]